MNVHGQFSGKAEEYLDGWRRARAEIKNLRQRQQEEYAQSKQAMTRAVVERVLEIADNFQALNRHTPSELASHPWVVGVVQVGRQVDRLLADYGVEPVGKPGEVFTPTRHEAIEEVAETTSPSGAIVEVLQTGYQLGEQVIRPAKVKVAK